MGNANRLNKKTRLSHSTWVKMWRLAGDLYSCATQREFFDVFDARLQPLIPHDSFVFFPIDPLSNVPETSGYIGTVPNVEKTAHDYGSYYHALDPLRELNRPSCVNRAIKGTDKGTRTELVNGEFFYDFLKPLGIDNVLGINTGVDGRYSVGGIGLHRGPGARNFSDRENTVLEFLSPHMANTLWNIRLRNHVADNHFPTLQERILLSGAHGLTTREKETAALVAQGFKNGEIAERLYISGHTVKDHMRSLYRKTGAHNRAGLVIHLLRQA